MPATAGWGRDCSSRPATQIGRPVNAVRRMRKHHIPSACDRRPRWTDEERALLGTVPDEEIAARIGRPVNAVRIERTRRGIPSACDRRRREP